MLPAPTDLSRWRRDLYAVTGKPNGTLSWLEPVWHGEPDVARIVLYQVIPAWATSPLFWDEGQRAVAVDGRPAPDPRFRVQLNPEALTWRQWQLYERFGCFAQPYWIVQGSRGGHKRQFNDVEQRLLTAMGRPSEPPLAGDLPYAPIDRRVFDALAQLDAMRVYAKAKSLYERSPEDFDADERDAVLRGSRRLNAWLDDQTAEAFDSLFTYRKRPADVFQSVGDSRLDLDALEAATTSS